MDMYGISSALQQGNNYNAQLEANQQNTDLNNLNDLNLIDTSKLGLTSALGADSGQEKIAGAVGLAQDAAGALGTYQASKRLSVAKDKATKLAKDKLNPESLTDDSKDVPEFDGNKPSLALNDIKDDAGVKASVDEDDTWEDDDTTSADPPQANSNPSTGQQPPPEEAQTSSAPTEDMEVSGGAEGGAEAGGDAVRTGDAVVQTSEDAGRGARLLSGAKSIGGAAIEGIESAGKYAGALGAVAGGGLSIAQDLDGGFKKMNTAQQIGNVASIGGSGLELAGLVAMAIPGGQVIGAGLEVFGELSSLFGGATQTAGEIAADQAKKTAATNAANAQQAADKAALAPVDAGAATAAQSGGAAGGRGSAQYSIQSSGGF